MRFAQGFVFEATKSHCAVQKYARFPASHADRAEHKCRGGSFSRLAFVAKSAKP
jgi:hypothetical protein